MTRPLECVIAALGGGGGVSAVSEIVFNQALANASLGVFTLAPRFKQAGLVIPDFAVTGVKVRVRGSLNEMYIGHASASGDAYDADSLIPVLFGGSASVSADQETETESDLVAFAWDRVTDFLVSFQFTDFVTLTANVIGIGTQCDLYFKAGVAEASIADKTAYSTLAGNLYCVTRVTAFG